MTDTGEEVPARSVSEVFVDGVEDALNGTPGARHPVQFEDVALIFVACTLCGAAVPNSDEWKNLHRRNHDDHNRVHRNIEDEARRYKSPPRYG